MYPPEVEYIENQIASHILLFFNDRAKKLLQNRLIRFVSYGKLGYIKEKIIAIPYDIPVPEHPENIYQIEFNGTELTLWNSVGKPASGNWQALPNETTPLWYQNSHGTLTPAWNLFGNILLLITFGEERNSSQRDSHGRFAAAFSPRSELNLLEVPTFNESIAAIIGALAGLNLNGAPFYELSGMQKPPVIVVSHDCDLLCGNDLITQAIRAIRIFLPLLKLNPPKIDNIWWIIRNALTPQRFYFDNITGMIDLERCFGYRSIFYILNGNNGRFGARSGFKLVPKLIASIPPGWDLGIHYNYDTFLDEKRFKLQLDQLRNATRSKIEAGRAHYLRFDPEQSFSFLRKFGIRIDESSGYADRIGFRNGIAGCFQVFDSKARKMMDMWEMPMTIMDGVLLRQYGDDYLERFTRLLLHLSSIGGALSIVFHPGQFFNPENRQLLGVYHEMLMQCNKIGAVSSTAPEMVAAIE